MNVFKKLKKRTYKRASRWQPIGPKCYSDFTQRYFGCLKRNHRFKSFEPWKQMSFDRDIYFNPRIKE